MPAVYQNRKKKGVFPNLWSYRVHIASLILFPLLISACMRYPTIPTSSIETSLILRWQDFPRGWEDGPFYHEEIPDALDSFFLDFHHKQSPGSYKFSYQLTSYENAEVAWNSISYWESRLFIEDAWPWPDEIVYQPLRSEDYFRIGCMDVLIDDIPFRWCRVLQVHDDKVIFLIANLDGEIITEEFMLAVLARVDERIQRDAPVFLDPIVIPAQENGS